MTQFIPAPLPACRERAWLPAGLVSQALALAAPPSTAEADDVERHLCCILQAHTGGDHYALVMDLDGRDTGTVWARWAHGHHPAVLTVLPDCDTTQAITGDSCCAYASHPGAHSYNLADTWHSPLPAASPHPVPATAQGRP